jgi:hypothetical protein
MVAIVAGQDDRCAGVDRLSGRTVMALFARTPTAWRYVTEVTQPDLRHAAVGDDYE